MKSKQLIMYLRSLAILSIVGLLVGCGGGGGGGSTPTPPAGDTTRPTVDSSSLSPDNHAIGVDPNTVISVTFSEDMDPTTITGVTFTVVGGGGAASGTISTIDDTTTFTPDAPLLRGITYTATIKAGVEDLAGNALAADYSWTFTIPVNIAAGANHTVSILSDGTLWAWGANDYGQLGNGTGSDSDFPVPITSPVDGCTWVSVAAGESHTIALLDNGTLWAWGNNDSGQLGIDDANHTPMDTPQPIGVDTDWVGVAAGRQFSVAIKADGTLWAWGDNAYGQLGKPSQIEDPANYVDYQDAPDQVNDDADWVAVSCGAGHVLALKSDGTLHAWGLNEGGQLGLGDINARSQPVQVGILDNWSAIGAGESHSLAINADGELYAWGLNDEGQLGLDIIAEPETEPQLVGAATNWVAVAAGMKHTIALNGDGELYSWGLNDQGQLGLGNTDTPEPAPLKVGTATDWVSVACGASHSLAFSDNGTPSLWSWGINGDGQLGDGEDPFGDTTVPNEIIWP
ncbi:MAG: Ig-like domain-containing protein [Syntrophaceae bacterium]|nr:Ig-like domain-containing protein [Deltaproteobacteria bacterium]